MTQRNGTSRYRTLPDASQKMPMGLPDDEMPMGLPDDAPDGELKLEGIM